ncbi:MAG: penicillin-binding protein 2, partial [Alphaproteobacteria bacterium]|nr:penicillin-binding protein 2 [Alphaproteobacteria bacterium]
MAPLRETSATAQVKTQVRAEASDIDAADARKARAAHADRRGLHERALRVALVFCAIGVGFVGVGVQLVRLGLAGQTTVQTSISRPLAQTFNRPDVLDAKGNILATDVVMQSLFADPSRLLGAGETLEVLEAVLPGVDTPALRRQLADRERRFVWIRRGLSPATAQRVHELGLPGIDFKPEPKRSYPQGRTAGHLIGHVNVDNKGTAGIERFIDEQVGIEQVVGDPLGLDRDVRLTIDLSVQAALESELAAAMATYDATAASGVIMDVATGAVRAAASLPSADPGNPVEAQHIDYLDRLKRGTYELGSIFKAVTVAMALERHTVTAATKFDVRNPIEIGRYRITDAHSAGRPLSVEEIFIHSSNVGSGMIALEVGADYQRQFLATLGLLDAMETDAGPLATPLVPDSWGRAEIVTIAYGHGLAVAPLQFAAAGATLLNGGFAVRPHFVDR